MDYFNLKEVEISKLIDTTSDLLYMDIDNDEKISYSSYLTLSTNITINDKDEEVIINPEQYIGCMVRLGDYIYIIYHDSYDVIKLRSKFNPSKPILLFNAFCVVKIVHFKGSRVITVLKEYCYDIIIDGDINSSNLIKWVDYAINSHIYQMDLDCNI
jgi:hypothetical protein